MTNRPDQLGIQPDQLTVKDQFQFLFAQASDLSKALPSYQFQFSAALVIVLGWLLTSSGAATFIQHNPVFSRFGSIVLTFCLVCFHCLWVIRHVRRAERLHKELAALAKESFPASDALIESVRIDPFLPWSYIIINVLMCAAVVLVCWRLATP